MTDALPSDFVADGQPFENPEASADDAYAATVPSLGAKLSADFGDGITAALGRAGQRGQVAGASWFDRLAATPDVDTAAGMVAAGQDPYPAPAPSPTISADDANKRFAPPGTTITDGPITEDLARVVGRQKADEVQRESVLSRYAAGHGFLANTATDLLLSPVMDPAGSAALFVPGIGEETVAAYLGEGFIARTTARAAAGASAGAAGMAAIGAAKYALGTEQDSDYSIRQAMYDLAGGAALGALGHAGFGALREAGILKPDGLMEAERSRADAGLPPVDAPTGLVSNEDLGAVVDAPATARFDALNAGVAQVLDGREIDVAPIFDQVRADRAEADLQRWTAQQGRLDAQSTAALRVSGAADAAAGTIESRAGVLQRRLDDLRDQHAGFLADIEAAEARRAAQTDTVTPERLQAIDAELADTAIPAARRADLENERSLLTEGRDPAADALDAARTEAELRGLQRGAATVQAEIDRTAPRLQPLQDQAAARRAAGSDALGAASDKIAPQEDMLRSLAARSIRRYAGAFAVPVTRDEADALAQRALRGGAGETAKVVAEIRGRAMQAAPARSGDAAAARSLNAGEPGNRLPGPPIEQQRAAITADVMRNLMAAGRPEVEARVAGRIVAAHYEARASRFGGALGTAEELYRDRAPEIRGLEDDAAPVPSAGGGSDGGAGGALEAAETGLDDATQDGGSESAGAAAELADDPREIAPGEPIAPEPDAVEQIAAAVMPEAVEPVRAAVEAEQQVQAAMAPGAPRSLSAYTPEAVTVALRGKDTPAGVFMFDPLALAVDADRFQFKSDGDAQGVTSALRGVTRWDPAKAQSVMVWEQADGRLFVADGHQRAGLARRLTEQGQAGGIELPGVLYRERDGVSADDARAIAAVTNIANGSGSALDGAKVLRARPDLLDGSMPLSAGKGEQAAALARLGDEAFRMVVNDVVPENFGAVVGQMLPGDEARQIAALKAMARFEPRSVEEATALTQRVASAELARADAGAQGSLFGDLDAPESTAGEEMRIVGRVIRDLRSDRGLFSRVVDNAGRLEQTGSTIARDAARSAATDAGAFAKMLSSDAYTAGPTRTALIAAARDLKDGRTTIGDAAARLHAAVRRSAEEDGADRLGARGGSSASRAGARGREGSLDAGRGADGSGRGGAAPADGTGSPSGGTGDDARGSAAGPARGRGSDGSRPGRAGRESRQGAADAAARARRGDRGTAARDGDALGRLIGDEAASRVVPLHDGVLDHGTAGEASLVEQMNDLLGRRPADAPREVEPRIHPDLIEAGDHVIHRVADAEDSRHYGVYARPAGGLDGVTPDQLGNRIGIASLGQHADDRWEVGNLKVDRQHRRQGIARKLYATIERDLGITMRPSGHLLPDGHAMWRARDPAAVHWHREVGTSFYSPKMLRENADMLGDQGLGPAFRAAFDALPPEAKTPEALRTMFQRRVEDDPYGLGDIRAAIEATDRGQGAAKPPQGGGGSPLDRRVSEDDYYDLKVGALEGEIRKGPDGRSYVLNDIEHDPKAGTYTSRWVALGPERTLGDVVSAAAAKATGDEAVDASARAMLDLFRSLKVDGTPTYTPEAADFAKIGDRADGFYGPDRNAVFLRPDLSSAKQLQIAVHEGVHAAFFKAMRNDRAVRADVEAMRKEAEAYRFKLPAERGEFSSRYGLQDHNEYVSEAFSNPAFQRYLGQIPASADLLKRLDLDTAASGTRSLWDAFVRGITRALGLSTAPETTSLLEATIRYGDKLSGAAEGQARAEAAEGGPSTLFQRTRDDARGSITFRPGDRPLVRLMRDADASTFVHEMGHDWLEQMMRDAEHPAAPEAFRADAAAVRDWLGNDGGELTEAQHEKWADGIVHYVRDGVAPSPELAGAFAQFRDWLTRIYRTMRGLGAEISPEIRGVFDRLLTPEPQPPAVPARPDVAALARKQQAVYRAGFAPGMPQAEFDALDAAVYGAKAPGGGDVRAAAPATSAARAGDAESTQAAGTPARTAADATLAAWRQRFQAAGVVPNAEERALLDDTAARLRAADLAADGYAQAGACLTAAGI